MNPILVWGLLSDGSHVHADGTRCRLNHKKGREFKTYLAIFFGIQLYALIVHLALISNGLWNEISRFWLRIKGNRARFREVAIRYWGTPAQQAETQFNGSQDHYSLSQGTYMNQAIDNLFSANHRNLMITHHGGTEAQWATVEQLEQLHKEQERKEN